ncbi:hypothetical protein AB0M43_21120 [Longispora sp. NPDC051575]|uniref:hypothetical protein n=1 Tax=Longispora sp. NPDC051575 TaxID=3154943 RepID=UPI003438C44D
MTARPPATGAPARVAGGWGGARIRPGVQIWTGAWTLLGVQARPGAWTLLGGAGHPC